MEGGTNDTLHGGLRWPLGLIRAQRGGKTVDGIGYLRKAVRGGIRLGAISFSCRHGTIATKTRIVTNTENLAGRDKMEQESDELTAKGKTVE